MVEIDHEEGDCLFGFNYFLPFTLILLFIFLFSLLEVVFLFFSWFIFLSLYIDFI